MKIIIVFFTVLILYIIILLKRLRQVKRQEQQHTIARETLCAVGGQLLEVQERILEKSECSDREKVYEIEITKYIKDYLLSAMKEGVCNEWSIKAMHGWVVEEYPEIFEAFK